MKNLVQRALIYVGLTALIVWSLHELRLIGFRYPSFQENQPLSHPIAIIGIEGDELTLADGRVLDLAAAWHDGVSDSGAGVPSTTTRLANLFADRPHTIQLTESPPGAMVIHYPAQLTGCFTPWANQGFIIPLIPNHVPRYHSMILAEGPTAKLVRSSE